MKKILAITLSIIMAFSLCACGNNKKAEKYCSSCGEGISKEVAFCEHCGAAVNNEKNESEDTSSDNSSSTESKTEETSKPTTSSKPSSSTSKPSTPTHTHSYSKKVTAATCTEKGYTTYTCSCGYSYKDNYTEPSHTYSKYKCTKCGQLDKAHTYEILVDWILENGENSSTGNYCVVEREDASAIIYHKATNYVYLQGTWFNMYNPDNDSTECFCIQIPEKITNNYYFAAEYEVADQIMFEFNGYLNPNTFTVNTPLTCNYFVNYSDISKNNVIEVARLLYVDVIKYTDIMLKGKYEGLTDSGLGIEDLGFTSFK